MSTGSTCLVEARSTKERNGELVKARRNLRKAEMEALRELSDAARDVADRFEACLAKVETRQSGPFAERWMQKPCLLAVVPCW